jgi:hypothetical protein
MSEQREISDLERRLDLDADRVCPHCGDELSPDGAAYCSTCRQPLDSSLRRPPSDALRKKIYAAFLDYRKSPPTVFRLLRKSLRSYLVLVPMIIGVAGLWIVLEERLAAAWALGMLSAIVLRDIGWFRRIRQAWPIEAEVLDWDKIERLTNKAEPVDPSAIRAGAPPTDARSL